MFGVLYPAHKLTVMFTVFLVTCLVDRYVRFKFLLVPGNIMSREILRRGRLAWWVATMASVLDFRLKEDWVWPIWQSYGIVLVIQVLMYLVFISVREYLIRRGYYISEAAMNATKGFTLRCLIMMVCASGLCLIAYSFLHLAHMQ